MTARNRLPRGILVAILGLLCIDRATAASLEHPLFQAIRVRDAARVESLLRQGTPVTIRAPDGTTPLMVAALHGTHEIVALLLERGADANAANAIGATPLIWAAGDEHKVRLLLARGADPNARSALGNTPLLAAAGYPNSTAIVDLLLESGASANPVNRRGLSALGSAAGIGNLETVNRLVADGAWLQQPATTFGPPNSVVPAVTVAAAEGHVDIVRFLLDQGADPNQTDTTFAGHALNHALLAQRQDIATTLMQHGADPTMKTPVGGVPPMVLAAYTEVGDTAAIRRLIEMGVDPNAASEQNETALTWARKRGFDELIDYLKRSGVKDGAADDDRKEVPVRDINLHAGNRTKLLRTSISKSLALMQHSSDVFLRNRESCVSCHHQNLPGIAMAWARDRGFAVDDGVIERMVERQAQSWSPSVDQAYQMDWPVPVSARFLGYGLLSFSALGYRSDEITDAMVWYLAAVQHPDGHWSAGIPGFMRPPLGEGIVQSTVLVMRSLQLYPLRGREAEFASRIAAARSWLLQAEPTTFQERVYQLMGLAWSGSTPGELTELTSALLDKQCEDGGWAQLPGLESDAWATGQTMVALHIAGGVATTRPAYQRGLAFLLRTQFDDGSWYVPSRSWPFQPHFDSEFPHGKDQWISAAGTAWATMALTLAVEPFGDAVVPNGTSGRSKPSGSYSDAPASQKPAAPQSAEPDEAARPASKPVDFAAQIKPLLQRSCLGCHGGDKPKGSFQVTSREALIRGGESGQPAIVPGNGARSPLVRFVSGQVEDMDMPPLRFRYENPALTTEEIRIVRDWIDQQAPWPEGVVLEAK